jgi:uncharacterized protein
LGIGVTVARLALNQLVQVQILDPQLSPCHPTVFGASHSVAKRCVARIHFDSRDGARVDGYHLSAGWWDIGKEPVISRDQRFIKQSPLPASARQAFDWHARPGAFERLCPPWEPVTVVSRTGSIHDGDRVTLRIKMLGPIHATWVAQHQDFIDGSQFRDVQISGPFARWEHTHSVVALSDQTCTLEDNIRYALPLAPLSTLVAGKFVKRKLDRMFAWRHAITQRDLQLHAGVKPMTIAITGSSGLIGRSLAALLTTGGHRVVHLVRPGSKQPQGPSISWNPESPSLDLTALGNVDAVIHLAGEPIVGRWTAEKKRRIHDSRAHATANLAAALAKLPVRPRALLVASAVGIYGNRGDEHVTESSSPGSDFLSQVGQAWEAAANPARQAGIRVAHLRLGIVLTPAGGALSKMLPAFSMGVGGVLGSGKQYWSWITLEDVIASIYHVLKSDSIQGPVNLVAPSPATNRQFTKALGSVLHRPTIFPVPAFVARAVFGELADAALLGGQRVQPTVLQQSGYTFIHSDLHTAFMEMLGR